MSKITKTECGERLAKVVFAAEDRILVSGRGTTAIGKMLEDFFSPIQATAIDRLQSAGAVLADAGGDVKNTALTLANNSDIEFALGVDTGGEVRQAAAEHGLFGYKPTYGMISRYGVVGMASSMDTVGVMAKSVANIESACAILARPDGKDGTLHEDFFKIFDTCDEEKNPKNLREINREIVGAAIISGDGKVLLGQNRKNGVYENYLIVPGGGIDDGETEIAALKREVMEEVGVDISGAKIHKIDKKVTGATEKTLRDSGERVWVKMNFNDYVIKFDELAAEISTKVDVDFGWVKWYSPADLKKEKMNLSTEMFLRDAGFLPEQKSDEKPLKIGLIKEFIDENFDPEIKQKTLNFAEKLRAAGHAVDEINLPMAKFAGAIYQVIAAAETASNLARYDGVRYGSRATGVKDLDELYSLTRENGFSPENKRQILFGTFVLSGENFDKFYLQAQKARTLLIQEFDKLFVEDDFLIGPVAPTLPQKIGDNKNDLIKEDSADILTAPASLAGLPAISLPNGNSKTGLPIGVQIIGSQKSDAELLAFAKTLEEKS